MSQIQILKTLIQDARDFIAEDLSQEDKELVRAEMAYNGPKAGSQVEKDLVACERNKILNQALEVLNRMEST